MNAITKILPLMETTSLVAPGYTARPDAELLALWAEYQAASAEIDRLAEEADAAPDPDAAMQAQEARVDELSGMLNQLSARIFDLPARTLAGIDVKLRCLAENLSDTEAGKLAALSSPIPSITAEDAGLYEAHVALGIARDLEALTAPTGVNAAVIAAVKGDDALMQRMAPPFRPGPVQAGSTPLLTLLEEYRDIRAIVHGMVEDHPLDARMDEIEDALQEAKPGTLREAVRMLRYGLARSSKSARADQLLWSDHFPGADELEEIVAHTAEKAAWHALGCLEQIADAQSDAEILHGFARWCEATRHLLSISPKTEAEQDAFDKFVDQVDNLARSISAIPANGPAGVAAKLYMDAHGPYGSLVDGKLVIHLEKMRNGDYRPAVAANALEDALRLAPEVLAIAAGTSVPADPDAEIVDAFNRWCAGECRRSELATIEEPSEQEEAEMGVADDIAREMSGMPAKTARGFAMKFFVLAHAQLGDVWGGGVFWPLYVSETKYLPDELWAPLLADAISLSPEVAAVLPIRHPSIGERVAA